MNDVLLLEGPDKNIYKATEISSDVWDVVPFTQFRSSDWWRTQAGTSWSNNCRYNNIDLYEIFTILAKTETYYEQSTFYIIHDGY